MSDSDRHARGKAKFAEVMQFEAPEFEGDPFWRATVDYLFPELWARPGLGTRERRIITLTVLISLGHEMPLKLHLGAAMKSGDLSDQEIDELILHVGHYAGWPTAAIASQVVASLRAERG